MGKILRYFSHGLCLLGLMTMVSSAWASQSFVPVFQSATDFHSVRQISFDGPIVLSSYSTVPYGFQQKDIAPPFRLGFLYETDLESRGRLAPWFSLNADFLRTNVAPVVEGTFGMRKAFDRFYFLFGFQITDQALPTQGPIYQSQYDTTYYGLIGGIGEVLEAWDLRLTSKFLFFHDTPIQSYEGIETDVGHQATWVISPIARYYSDFNLDVLAGMDIYSLGEAGIASKEFAFGIPATTLVRLRAGLTYHMDPFEFRAELRVVPGVSDDLGHEYQAIFMGDDYLLSPATLYLGVAWNF